MKCTLCGCDAATTAAHIPVCAQHWEEYAKEAGAYLPDERRDVWLKLIAAHEAQTKQDEIAAAETILDESKEQSEAANG